MQSNDNVSPSATDIVVPSDIIVGTIDGKPTIERKDVDEILIAYFENKLATVDYKPSILEKSIQDHKIVSEWVPYNQSEHFRLLLTESDNAIKQKYRAFKQFNFKVPKNEFSDILGLIFSMKKIDLFLEWVKSKGWDGIDRLTTLHKAIGLTTTPRDSIDIVPDEDNDLYCRAITHMLTVGAIQRHFEPYVQDYIPVIIGDGNAGKSTTLKGFLGNNGKWFSVVQGSISPDHNGREFYRLQFGKAITELKELDSLLKKDNTGLVKALLDGDIVEFNEKNEKGTKRVPLTSFMCGTTNHDQFLFDRTGNRRFLPIYMNRQNDTLDREQLKTTNPFDYVNAPLYLPNHPEYAQQIMAQAYQLYLDGEKYDFYIDRKHPETDTITKVQSILNSRSSKELEGMDQFVSFAFKKCDENPYNSVSWAELKETFQDNERGNLSITHCLEIFKDFKENPTRFGFSYIKTVQISPKTLDDNGRTKGIRLIDKEMCLNYIKGRSLEDDLI